MSDLQQRKHECIHTEILTCVILSTGVGMPSMFIGGSSCRLGLSGCWGGACWAMAFSSSCMITGRQFFIYKKICKVILHHQTFDGLYEDLYHDYDIDNWFNSAGRMYLHTSYASTDLHTFWTITSKILGFNTQIFGVIKSQDFVPRTVNSPHNGLLGTTYKVYNNESPLQRDFVIMACNTLSEIGTCK